jgi:phospholipid/cholesterol/gamma-HCH transport system substrate-binding protein
MGEGRSIRLIALGALAAAAIAVVAVVLLGGEGYRVKLRLVNASQLVKGNLVTVAGERVGSVEAIDITEDGQAEVEISVEGDYAPLRRGTRAVIRQLSLSGVANRYVDLQLGGATGAEIPAGETVPSVDTQANVDLDQIFNTFDPVARTAVGRTIRLFRDFNRGSEEEAGRALRLLAPSLASTSRLFREINRNTPDFERFIVQTGRLMEDLSSRGDDLAGTIQGLGTTMNALADERDDLGRAIELLPGTMRRANTTFVNLRAALDDLDPLVDVTRPALRELRPLFAQLRPFARDVVPTARDLSRTIRAPGERNDLIDLFELTPAVDRIATQTAERNGRQRPGALPEAQRAFRGATPQLAFWRPFTPDLVGWFDDFSHSGAYDALGSFSRAGLQLNQFTFTPGVPTELLPVPLDLRPNLQFGALRLGRSNRCPGSVERTAPDGSNPYVPPNVECDRAQQPVGERAGP